MDVVFAYITVPDEAIATKIAESLVNDRIAAGVNILNANSVYRWQGKVCHAPEVVLMAKTRADAVDALRDRVVALHPYDVPCIVAFPAIGGHGPYLDWVNENTDPNQ